MNFRNLKEKIIDNPMAIFWIGFFIVVSESIIGKFWLFGLVTVIPFSFYLMYLKSKRS